MLQYSRQVFRLLAAMILFSVMALAPGCSKEDPYPVIPEIEFTGYANLYDTGMYATKGVLTIGFRDGDGDIGLATNDTLYPYNKSGLYYYNYVIAYWELQMGTWVPVDLNPPYSARIPVLTPFGMEKSIRGIIVDTLNLNPVPVFDTIKFELFIYDRALHKSNVIFTPPITVRKQ
jgi:hypothetical protein